MDTLFFPAMDRPSYRRRCWPLRRPQYDDGYAFDALFHDDDSADDDFWYAPSAPVLFATPRVARSGRQRQSNGLDKRAGRHQNASPSPRETENLSECCECKTERKTGTTPSDRVLKRTTKNHSRDPLAIEERAKQRRMISPWSLLFDYPSLVKSRKTDKKRDGTDSQVQGKDHRWRHTLSMPDVDPDTLRVRVVEDDLVVEGQQRVRTFWSAFNVEIRQTVKAPPYVDLQKLCVTYIDGVVCLEAPSVAKDIKVASVEGSVQKNKTELKNYADDDGIRVTPMDAVETEIDAEYEKAKTADGSSADDERESAVSVSRENESTQIERDSAEEKTEDLEEVKQSENDNTAADGEKRNVDHLKHTPGVTLPVINPDGSEQIVEVVRVDPITQVLDTNPSDDDKNFKSTKDHTPNPKHTDTPCEIVERKKDTQIIIEKDCNSVDVNTEASMTKVDFGRWLLKEDVEGPSAQMNLDLSFFAPDEIEARVKDNIVSVHGKHRSESEGSQTRVERFYQYQLPSDSDATKLRCRVTEKGILNISVPFVQ